MVGTVVLASAAGLGMLAGLAMADGGKRSTSSSGGGGGGAWRPSCGTCGGTGKVPCLCGRWSDGDAGCRTCAGSGSADCLSCHGSGTGRRAPVRLAMRALRPPVTRREARR